MPFKAKEVLRRLQRAGFEVRRQAGRMWCRISGLSLYSRFGDNRKEVMHQRLPEEDVSYLGFSSWKVPGPRPCISLVFQLQVCPLIRAATVYKIPATKWRIIGARRRY